jgi:hypothetical protein
MEDWMEELEPLLSGEVLNKPMADLSNAETATVFAMLHHVERLVKVRKEALREKLLAAAADEGSATEKGGYVVEYDGTKVIREKRVATSPNADAVRTLLEAAGLEEKDAFSQKTSWVLDPSKLKKLIDTGKLDADTIEKSKEVNLALKVFPSNEIEHAIKDAQALYSQVFEEDIEKQKLSARGRAKKAAATGPRKGKKDGDL